jgi:hypothetical protein
LFQERFDTTNQFFNTPTVATATKQVDSWSGYAENISSGAAVVWTSTKQPNPYVTAQGTIRFWVAPNWSSGQRTAKTPGTLAEICSWIGNATYPQLSIQVTPDGSAVGVSENGQVVLGARINWTNSIWHQVAVTYGADASILYLDGQAVSKGAGFEITTTKGSTGICLGSDETGKNQADAAYDEFTTLYYPATPADITRLYLFAASTAALGPVTAAEIAAKQALRAQNLAARKTTSLMSAQLGAQPMGLSYSDLTTGTFRLIQTAFYFTNSTSISNISQVTIAGSQTNLSYDVFRTRALLSSITNCQWVWVGRGQPGQTLNFTNEPMDMAFYIGATTNDTDGDGITDAYETLVTHTSPTQPPGVAITTPTNSTSIVAPASLSISITASNYITPFNITVFVNGQSLGSQQSYYATVGYSLTELGVGNYAISASLIDAAGQHATSSIVNVAITLPELSSLKCWLKGDSIISTNGYGVFTWLDSSGNSNNGVAFAGTAPIYKTNQVNALPALAFGGSNFMQLPSILTSQGEAFVVIKPLTGTNSPLWNQAASDYNTNVVIDAFGSSTAYAVGLAPELNGYHIYDVSANTGSWIARLNGRVVFSSPTNTVNFGTNFNLGMCVQGSITNYGTMSVAEILLFTNTLAEIERIAVGRYLNNKYFLITNSPVVAINCQGVDPQHTLVTWTATNATELNLSRITPDGTTTLLDTNSQATAFNDLFTSFDVVTYSITARNYVSTTTATVQTPLMLFTSPVNGATYYTGQGMTVSLTPYSAGIPGFGSSFTPAQVTMYANGAAYFTNMTAPWGFSTTNWIPMHWNLSALTYDSSSNSRFTAVFGVNTIEPIDSDGDGVPDYLDPFPYDPTRWTNSTQTNSTSAPGIIITEP